MAKRDPRISWQIEEYPHKDKSPDWFWALGVIAVASATVAIIYNNTLFGIFILLAAVILGFYAARKPDIIDVALSDAGITIRDIFYSYEKVKGFAVDESELGTYLIIETSRTLAPIMSVHVPPTLDPDSIRDFLKEKTTEKPMKEELSHKVMEHLGF